MNTKRIISSIGVGAGAIILGLGIQYAVAQTWTGAPSSPPQDNVPAPINVGTSTQVKNGLLGVVGLITNTLNVGAGASTTAGSVLVNDGSGNASWENLAQSCSDVYSLGEVTGSSGNNDEVIKNVGILQPGTYTFVGTGTAKNAGGGGIDSIFFSTNLYPNNIYGSDSPNIPPEVSKYYVKGTYSGPDTVYYYNSSTDPSIIYAVSRKGQDSSTNWTIPNNTTITFSKTTYLYVILAQASEDGFVGVLNSSSNCQ